METNIYGGDMTSIKHDFRANLWSDWEKVSIENDVITYQKGEQEAISIAVSDILSVRLAKNYGGSFTCHIHYADKQVLKINTGAIKTFGSPYQNLESFALFAHALLVRPNPPFQIYVGSNAMYYFSVGSLVVGGLMLIGVVLILFIKGGGMPAHVQWKVGVVVTMLALFSWPLMKFGKAKSVEAMDAVPYELSVYALVEANAISKLQDILLKAKEGMQPWENVPESEWSEIASQCQAPEREEIEQRIKSLKEELESVEAWDGDTQDDIHKTIYFFEQLIALSR